MLFDVTFVEHLAYLYYLNMFFLGMSTAEFCAFLHRLFSHSDLFRFSFFLDNIFSRIMEDEYSCQMLSKSVTCRSFLSSVE